jgi:hypothetical protein
LGFETGLGPVFDAHTAAAIPRYEKNDIFLVR